MIQCLPFADGAQLKDHVFISYSWADQKLAVKIKDRLKVTILSKLFCHIERTILITFLV